jgi:hypothetical protein
MTTERALADPTVKVDEIVQHFVSSGAFGPGRGICLGTAEECAKTASKSAGLDMLINFDLGSAVLRSQAREEPE